MKQLAKIIFGIYALVVVLELLFIYFDQPQLRWFTKPLLMPLLMLGFYIASAKQSGTFFKLILVALLLSWAGDVLLQMKGMFIPGLVSFLLAHVFYIVYFLKTGKGQKGLIQLQPLIGIPVLIYILIFLWQLYPFLDALKIPVTVYGITIGTMLLSAINTKRKTSDNAAVLFLIGAILFVISDSLLAVNLFAMHDVVLSLCVMLTYAAAQYLIVKGALINNQPN
ncbi:lysoplasmalogenase [Lacibacter sediminis]|uniref:Lysoplasmalogenase n=1 Tax=Lacibacter sediminis TaxID=2760713 RepID=A0A7G5XDI0_9BACT|nr:lysoplasmalogenase [Lacibacter sediminis]QNA43533.1 lysoplasmalogenase [Lacibacter sediminis]